jgi:hypothetical protein
MQKDFSYLFSKKQVNNIKQTSKSAKKFIFWLILVFAFCFFFKDHIDNATLKWFYNIYYFVVNQTLGIVHEAGHGVCYILPCPRFLMVINGTLFQLAFPWGIGYYYRSKGDKFAYFIAQFFLGFSLSYTAWYIGTSHDGPIIPASKSFLGVDAYHDFYYILSHIGLLAYSGFISALTSIISAIIMLRAIYALYTEAYIKES